MSFDPGQLRHRPVIQRNVPVQDSNGDWVDDWQYFDTVWAGYEPLSVRDFIQSGAKQAEVASRFTIRYRTDLDASMRFIFRGQAHEFVGLLPDKDSGIEYLTIPCKAGVAVS